MDGSHQALPGFDPHVSSQLQQLASSNSQRGRRWQQHADSNRHQQLSHHNYQSGQPAWNLQQPIRPGDPNSFPPLGSSASSQSGAEYNPVQSHSYHPQQQGYRRNNNYRGSRRGGNSGQQYPRHQYVQPGANDFYRPAPTQGHLYNPAAAPYFDTAEQQRAHRQKIMTQSDFLGSLANIALKDQIPPEEFQAKESFRKVVQAMVRDEIVKAYPNGLSFNVDNIKLKLYGSLGSGFGVAGSDMDLLLTFPQDQGPLNDIEIESRRLLEKALLDAGYGARLLTNTRVPILKVCEKPSVKLLESLRDYRRQWEDSLNEPPAPSIDLNKELELLSRGPALELEVIDGLLDNLSLEAANAPLPPSPVQEAAKLDFIGDCGIQCDINFTNYVALRNTELLRTYGQFDHRVRQVGLFVKHWAKARDINTPYRGTLSSYGYIMLVLHFLMNVVNPPIIPNLQVLAKDQADWNLAAGEEIIEGYDVRFIRHAQQLEYIKGTMLPNHESVGSLLRGFFWYYASNSGFHWTQDVISIRSPGGRITKRSKGWTGAKWQEGSQHVRLRYLLAIEDPFELEHNIGRTVGHSGIVTIRDELRRAWGMIESVQYDARLRAWFWQDKGEQKPADDFMAVVENRGDLLRRDHDAHKEKEKLRRMREEAEAKEQALREPRLAENETNGTWTDAGSENASQFSSLQHPDRYSSKLIHNRFPQDKKREWNTYPSRRKIHESDESDEDDRDEEVLANNAFEPTPVSWSNDNRESSPARKENMWLDLSEPLQNNPSGETKSAVNDWPSEYVDTWDENKPGGGLGDQGWDPKFAKWDVVANSTPWTADQPDDEMPPVSEACDDDVLSDPCLDPEQEVREESEMVEDVVEDAAMKDEIMSQRQNQLHVLGDQVFARDKNAQTHLDPHNRPSRDDRKVGRMIFWDTGTEGGRWLRWRDRNIVAGNWLRPRDRHLADLDSRFPYDPDMTYADLGKRNFELRECYLHGVRRHEPHRSSKKPPQDWAMEALRFNLHPAGVVPGSEQDQASGHATNRQDVVAQPSPPAPVPALLPESAPEQTPQPVLQQKSLPTKPVTGDRPSSTTSTLTDSSSAMSIERLRELRAKYFSQHLTMKQSGGPGTTNSSTVDGSGQKASPDRQIPVACAARHDSGVAGMWFDATKPSQQRQQQQRSKTHTLAANDDALRADSPFSSQQTQTEWDNTSLTPSEGKVPLTLYPGVSNDRRPVDEDPAVMPIPRSLGFRFDPRQLAALDIIRNGGNGCARRGEEFNVEEDYEWGGGGAMGHKSSTQPPDPAGHISSGREGAGDEEELLRELPFKKR